MLKQSTLPLLNSHEKATRFEEKISPVVALIDVVKMGSMCFIGTMFIPVNVVVNTMVLGHEADSRYLAGLGLGSATVGMYAAFSWTFSQGAAVIIAQAYGQEEHRMCQVYANRQFYLSMITYAAWGLMVLNIEKIFTMIG